LNSTLAYLRGRRAWMVENLSVWGADDELELFTAITETVNGSRRVGFKRVGLGGWRQEILFSDLTDRRGNNLPEEISQPAIVVLPRSVQGAHIKTVQGNSGFVIARSDDQKATANVDLLIFETG